MPYESRPLPQEALRLFDELQPYPRLRNHLILAHDSVCEILDGLSARFPSLELDRDLIALGAATHDLGKCIHSEEITGPGCQHEAAGPGPLEQHGLTPEQWNVFARLDEVLDAVAARGVERLAWQDGG